ncbi:MAG TPA: membrane protein insertase YidC [Nitrospirota bacterium]|nr:membrane protein insertase YidC [Nitrospirota bacterium]
METRRFLLAISLAFLVFWIYTQYFVPQQPQEPAPAETTAPQAPSEKKAAVAPVRPEAIAAKIKKAPAGQDIVIETDVLNVVLNTAGGVVKKWELKKFREADKTEVGVMALFRRFTEGKKQEAPKKKLGDVQLVPSPEDVVTGELVRPLTLVPLDKALATVGQVEFQTNRSAVRLHEGDQPQTVTLFYRGPGGLSIEKRLTFHAAEYKVDVAVITRGLEGYTLSLGTDFGIADKISSDASGRVGIASLLDGKLVTEKVGDIEGEIQHAGNVEWFGQEDKYFTATLVAGGTGIITVKRTPAPKETGDLLVSELTLKDKVEDRTFLLYAGPKTYTGLAAYGRGMERLVDFGWFTILAKPMFWLLRQFYALFNNYGVAIILLTIVVRILLYYPSLKSALAMEEMKAIQPQLTEIREKFKKDPQRMNQEMMKLYKEHKVNPMGGCLPMLLQLPFFVALYNVLNVSIELRQAPFISFWIKDLSTYDPYYILPVLMGVSMVATMKMTSTTVDPQQQKIMMYMNVAFIFLFAWLPAGLLLYITLSNVLSIVQQILVRRRIAAGKR